jgi:hypothetical protein
LTCERSRALTVILLGFNNGRVGRMARSRTRGGLIGEHAEQRLPSPMCSIVPNYTYNVQLSS